MPKRQDWLRKFPMREDLCLFLGVVEGAPSFAVVATTSGQVCFDVKLEDFIEAPEVYTRSWYE